MIKPPGLKKGDSIYICTPAKAIDKELVLVAKKQIEDRGYKVIISKNCFGKALFILLPSPPAVMITDFSCIVQNYYFSR